MIIVTHRSFDKKYKKLPKKLQKQTTERIVLFSTEPFHQLLDNHPLDWEWAGHRSINVTGDYRAVFKEVGNTAIFVDVDTHHNLYGS